MLLMITEIQLHTGCNPSPLYCLFNYITANAVESKIKLYRGCLQNTPAKFSLLALNCRQHIVMKLHDCGCGGIPHVTYNVNGNLEFAVTCEACGNQTPFCESLKEAVGVWNRIWFRAFPDYQPKLSAQSASLGGWVFRCNHCPILWLFNTEARIIGIRGLNSFLLDMVVRVDLDGFGFSFDNQGAMPEPPDR